MARKISAAALKQTLTDAKGLLEASVKHHHWMVAKCWHAVNWNDNTQQGQQVEKSLVIIEDASRTIRDIDHAIAAIEGETDE